MCDAVYWNFVLSRAPFRYMCSLPPHVETCAFLLMWLIIADLPFHAIGEDNPLSNSCVKASDARKGAKKVCVEFHDFIMAEILRREALEDFDSANNTDSSGDVSGSSSSSSAGESSSSSDSE